MVGYDVHIFAIAIAAGIVGFPLGWVLARRYISHVERTHGGRP